MGRHWRPRRRGAAAAPPSAAVLPPASPSVPPELDGLLHDVRDLRLTLASDLSLAAGAAEAGAEEVASDILAADRGELVQFVQLAETRLSRLHDVVVPPPRAPRWRRRIAVSLPAVPLVGAMALSAAAATGALPLPGTTAHAPTVRASAQVSSSPAVDSAFEQSATLVDGYPSAQQVLAAAAVLHRRLADLIATTPQDPGRVREIEHLLAMEQSLLLRRQPPGTELVLAAAHRLAARLDDVATPVVGATSLPPTPVASTAPHRHRWESTHTSASPTSTSQEGATSDATASPPPSAAPTSAPTPAPTTAPPSNQLPAIPD